MGALSALAAKHRGLKATTAMCKKSYIFFLLIIHPTMGKGDIFVLGDV